MSMTMKEFVTLMTSLRLAYDVRSKAERTELQDQAYFDRLRDLDGDALRHVLSTYAEDGRFPTAAALRSAVMTYAAEHGHGNRPRLGGGKETLDARLLRLGFGYSSQIAEIHPREWSRPSVSEIIFQHHKWTDQELCKRMRALLALEN
ncbi:MAG: hypothetical protein R3C70_07145 [Geminicoccaceae bacterium]